MFSVYKYYENPNLLVKSNYYTGKDEFVEIKSLVPNYQFYDAPEIPASMVVTADQTVTESANSTLV